MYVCIYLCIIGVCVYDFRIKMLHLHVNIHHTNNNSHKIYLMFACSFYAKGKYTTSSTHDLT